MIASGLQQLTEAFWGQGLGRVGQGVPLWANRGMVVGARLGDVDLLAGGVAVSVPHTRVGDVRLGENDIPSLFDELFRVCFKEGSLLGSFSIFHILCNQPGHICLSLMD
jgi:hypothetical protein